MAPNQMAVLGLVIRLFKARRRRDVGREAAVVAARYRLPMGFPIPGHAS
ncbi:predicted protein [Chaetomium globosum CBS 148.51]|uniref:Uncharacterized protein n=1 Tax=Chaetomium globosum (strain ATCC 6205 / CBS 148.51 / DSM 1962 / NBRC 6347 / NRRL 1970) TaxID=306901 RepID=Q2GP34_CHAGB|nr:uncharacterized protein CHGG_10270 [Chaetomium globosum CBS 148.51]EAQ83866.1 predicted protein [Chaetomium globosum CBS 148.51]